jgi:hypothetical protein
MEPRKDRLPLDSVCIQYNDDGTTDEVRPRFAGAYEVSMAYGGPEEGGWYTTLYIPLASAIVRDSEDPMTVARTLWDAFSHLDDGRDISSVLATGAVCILWEKTPGEHAVTSVGHYE